MHGNRHRLGQIQFNIFIHQVMVEKQLQKQIWKIKIKTNLNRITVFDQRRQQRVNTTNKDCGGVVSMCSVQQSYRAVGVNSATSFRANIERDRVRPLEFTERTAIAEERSLTVLLRTVQSPRQAEFYHTVILYTRRTRTEL